MGYGISSTKVVLGVTMAYVGYVFATETWTATGWLGGSTIFLAGLFLAVHGSFTGIEAAIDAGTDRPIRDRSTE